ncbi:hypothetical protein M9Y10_033723 [Tritrichomonas musculus]|uniref:sn-1-specific diacylglycerol lipase n=1 Tax=Tritrichomonas musculus TaxID=1915356 RepID=A0ABR2KCY1_9EUKA
MVSNIALPSSIFLQLAIRLSHATYKANFSNFTGLIYKNSSYDTPYHPVFYVYSQDNTLFVLTRGSKTYDDFATAAIFSEMTTEYGTFHTGYYKSALYVWKEVKDYVRDFSGKVVFVGHSYGAAVSQILHIFANDQFPRKGKKNSIPYESYCFAAPPTMNEEAYAPIKNYMFTFVNDDDIVPTISIPNCLNRFHLIAPVINIIPQDVLTKTVLNLLKLINITSLLDQQLFNMIYRAVPTCINAIKECEAGVPKLVKFTGGTVFQMKIGEPKKLAQCLIDPSTLNMLSITLNSVKNHHDERYIDLMDQIIPENFY